jgi:tripartite-type tricarboxylate transporter receptor subunit TctC
MTTKSYSMAAGLGALSVVTVAPAASQSFPNKPIRILALPPGSGTDFEARLIASAISGPLGQPVIIENRPNVLGAELVARAQADGYTMLNTGASMWTAPLLQSMNYDPVKDFAPISLVSSEPMVLTVPPALGVKSVRDLIAYAKSRAGQLNYSATGTGGVSHIANELFKMMTGINVVRVSYKNQTAAVTDMMGGDGKNVHMAFFSAGTVTPHAKAGRVIMLAVSAAEPTPLAPGLATVSASGVPGYEFTAINGLFAPAKTPDAVIRKLNEEVVRYLHSPAAKEKFFANGTDPGGSSPKDLAAAMQAYVSKTSKVLSTIKEAGTIAN